MQFETYSSRSNMISAYLRLVNHTYEYQILKHLICSYFKNIVA